MQRSWGRSVFGISSNNSTAWIVENDVKINRGFRQWKSAAFYFKCAEKYWRTSSKAMPTWGLYFKGWLCLLQRELTIGRIKVEAGRPIRIPMNSLSYRRGSSGLEKNPRDSFGARMQRAFLVIWWKSLFYSLPLQVMGSYLAQENNKLNTDGFLPENFHTAFIPASWGVPAVGEETVVLATVHACFLWPKENWCDTLFVSAATNAQYHLFSWSLSPWVAVLFWSFYCNHPMIITNELFNPHQLFHPPPFLACSL